ncbi:Host cell factor 2 [Leucoagaricus sp. SymC.cos]|nr:Host cell factor 2 [Leucoagaricus sp. SymC.cos]
MRSAPRLVYDKEAEAAPSTGMYWSRAPVFGAIPNRTMRAHSVTVVDNVLWLFGGCDERESWRDIYCLDVETMQWTHPECQGDIPPPSRAHSATLVDRKIVFIGGGHGSIYYDTVYILDTSLRRWSRPIIAPGPTPPHRRAHTAVLYGNKIWVFGGGNGMVALDDVWTLDVNGSVTMNWELVETKGVKKPGPRGYHTANLVGNIMVVIGGSDGKDSFDELWTLDLDTRIWTHIKTNMPYKRLAHSSTQIGSYLFIYGGHDSTEYTSELVLLNLVSLQYETRTVYGKIPAPRGYHAAVLADSRLFLIGGFNGLTSFDDVQILELAASAYLPQVTSFSIEALVP